MSKRLVFMSLASVLLAAQISAQPAPAEAPGLVCEGAGYDVILLNTGEEPVAEQTRLIWTVSFTRESGEYLLKSELAPGSREFISGVLSTYVGVGTGCSLEITETEPPEVE